MKTLLVENAKKCLHKQDWQLFFRENETFILELKDSKPLEEIARLLMQDNLSLNYDTTIWECLIEASLNAWNLELALKIAQHCGSLTSAKIARLSAKAYIEKGDPESAKPFLKKALRLKELDEATRLRLELMLALCAIEQGKKSLALRYLNRIHESLSEIDNWSGPQKGETYFDLGRSYFFLGQYKRAGEIFAEAYKIYRALDNWLDAVRSIYNAGSALINEGVETAPLAFQYMEECRAICEEHGFMGPLSHVEAFYGHNCYWHGQFAAAKEHYRKAHEYLPRQDQGFRTLHITSMLSFIYLRMGLYSFAQKFGEKTLTLAKKDLSERFRSRYVNLEAELLWEKGDYGKSQDIIFERTALVMERSIQTLEDLSTVSRFLIQCAYLGIADLPLEKYSIPDNLKNNKGDWIEFLHAYALYKISSNAITEARKTLRFCLKEADAYGEVYYAALSRQAMILCDIREGHSPEKLSLGLRDFEIAAAKLGDLPVREGVFLLRAAIAYAQGDLKKTMNHLTQLYNFPKVSKMLKDVCEIWLDTLSGKAAKIHSTHLKTFVGTLTRWYFAVDLSRLGPAQYLISGHHPLDLREHPALSKLLEHLIRAPGYTSSFDEIQEQAWGESIRLKGYEQKIRNAVARLRDLTTCTLAPLVLSTSTHHISLYSEAILVKSEGGIKANSHIDEAVRLLRSQPVGTQDLSRELKVSLATAKRLVAEIQEHYQTTTTKIGRKFFYKIT